MLFNRKLMALAMTAVLSAGLLAGCGSKEESAEGAADPAAAAPSSKIILVGSTSVDPLAQKLLTLELNIKKTVGNTRFAPCFQRFFCTLILDSSLNSILLHSETESKSCSV